MSRSQQNADYLTQYNWMPYRNKLINGDFRIDQRFAGTSTTLGLTYVMDRWAMNNSTGTMTKQRVANGPYGNTYSAQYTVTSVGTRAASDYYYIGQSIEGLNMNDLQWGYSTAKTCTLSFWVKNSLTGTYGGALISGNVARSYGFTYTVNVASTWEYKTIIIPGDITGGSTAYPSDNTSALAIRFGFGCGSNYSMSAGSWQVATNMIDVTGTASFAQTAGAVVNISMVQFEVGSIATPFENRPIGVELALCQRYYDKSFPASTAPVQNFGRQGAIETLAVRTAGLMGLSTYVRFSVPMRTMPALTFYNPSAANAQARNIDLASDCSATNGDNTANNSTKIQYTLPTSTVAGNLISVHFTAEAEL